MAYLGKPLQFAQYPSKFFSGDGTAQTVALDYSPPNKASVLVFIEGVRQDTSAYNTSGTNLTFTGTTPVGTNNIEVVQLGLQTPVGTAGAVQATGTADATTFLRGDYAWSEVSGGTVTTVGEYFNNYTEITADTTFNIPTTENAFLSGPITINDGGGTVTMTLSSTTTLKLI
jgi:hypothetical protein